MLQCVAVQGSIKCVFVLECITVYWSELQCVSPVRFNTICASGSVLERIVCVTDVLKCYRVLQYVAVCCSALQHGAVWFSLL